MQEVIELEKLAALRQSGALTDDEFNLAKGRIVSHLANPHKAPPWMKPASEWAFVISFYGCIALLVLKGQTESNPVNLAMCVLTSPLFFGLLPLGLYWRSRAVSSGPPIVSAKRVSS